jgi:hypothetical protein
MASGKKLRKSNRNLTEAFLKYGGESETRWCRERGETLWRCCGGGCFMMCLVETKTVLSSL